MHMKLTYEGCICLRGIRHVCISGRHALTLPIHTEQQKVKSQNFLHLLPQNYSSMRELVGRVAAGLFSPEKQSERVGTNAKPSGFSLAYALPADTQLEYFAGSCDGSNYALQVKAVFNANSKLYYSTVTPPTTSKSKTAAKTTNFFRDFTFPLLGGMQKVLPRDNCCQRPLLARAVERQPRVLISFQAQQHAALLVHPQKDPGNGNPRRVEGCWHNT